MYIYHRLFFFFNKYLHVCTEVQTLRVLPHPWQCAARTCDPAGLLPSRPSSVLKLPGKTCSALVSTKRCGCIQSVFPRFCGATAPTRTRQRFLLLSEPITGFHRCGWKHFKQPAVCDTEREKKPTSHTIVSHRSCIPHERPSTKNMK